MLQGPPTHLVINVVTTANTLSILPMFSLFLFTFSLSVAGLLGVVELFVYRGQTSWHARI